MKTAVFGASSSLPSLVDRPGKLVWSAEEKASLFSVHFHAKQCSMIVFSSRKLVTLHRYCVWLPSGLALFEVCYWIWILMVEMIQMICVHFFTSR